MGKSWLVVCWLYLLACYQNVATSFGSRLYEYPSTSAAFSDLTCSFDYGSCGWTVEDDPELEGVSWYRTRGQEIPQTGPSHDHTSMSTTKKYLLMNTAMLPRSSVTYSSRQRPFRSVLSNRFVVAATNDSTCLSFYYFMHGYDVGYLNVWKYTDQSEKTRLLSIFGPQGRRWYRASVPVGKGQEVKLKFEGIHVGEKNVGNIAIDDISLSFDDKCGENNQESPKFNCDFNTDFCSWYPVGNWYFRKYVGSKEGHAYYWDSAWGPKEKAYLRGPTISVFGKGACLSFRYLVNSPLADEVSILLYEYGRLLIEGGKKLRTLPRLTRYPRTAFVTIPPVENVYLAFFIMPKADRRSRMVIYDIALTNTGPCQGNSLATPQKLEYGCTFESDTCDWFQKSASPTGQWLRHQGRTSTPQTGPQGDHTTGEGHYLFLNASEVNKVQLYSPLVNVSKGGACFSIWHHMRGEDVHQLTLLSYNHLAFIDRERRQILWQTTGNKGDVWIQSNVTVPASGNIISVVVEATRSYFPRGDIAIDDVSLSLEGPCKYETVKQSQTPSPTTETTTTSTAPDSTTTALPKPTRPDISHVKPEVRVRGQISPAKTGSTVQLECVGNQSTYVEWTLSKPSKRFGYRQTFQDDKVLRLDDMTLEDANSYSCRMGTMEDWSHHSTAVHITVETDRRPRPLLRASGGSLDPASPGSRIRLTCGDHVEGAGYNWTFADTKSETSQLTDSHVLVLDNLTEFHSGHYRCCIHKDGFQTPLSNIIIINAVRGKACHSASQCRGSAYTGICSNYRCVCRFDDSLADTKCLERPSTPKMEVLPEHSEFGVGETFYLQCQTTTTLAESATYQFFKDGVELPKQPGSDQFYVHMVQDISLDDSGNYSCTIKYDALASPTSLQLAIQVKEFIDLSCDFQVDLCLWSHRKGMNDFILTPHSLDSYENYLSVSDSFSSFSSEVYQGGAFLRSPVIDEIRHEACLTLRYRMTSGYSISLSLWIYENWPVDQSIKGSKKWEVVGFQGTGWHNHSLEIPPKRKFYIVVQGQGRVEIDDFRYSIHGIC